MSFKIHFVPVQEKTVTKFEKTWCDTGAHWYHFNQPVKGWQTKTYRGFNFRTCPVCSRKEKVLMHALNAKLPIQERNLGFNIGNVFEIKPNNAQIKTAQKIYKERRKEMVTRWIEYMYWLDGRSLVCFKNHKSSFWEMIAQKTGAPKVVKP